MTTEYSSCSSNPLLNLEDGGVAPDLKYSLPQKSCLDANGVYPLSIEDAKFEDDCFIVTGEGKGHFWTVDWNLIDDTVIKTNIANYYTANVANNAVNPSGESNDFAANKTKISLSDAIKAGETVSQAVEPGFDIAGISAGDLATKVKEGLRPIEAINSFGDVELSFMKEPSSVKPKLYIIEHYKTCNFLGDYGAGKTVKTMSLLPGEKVTISIRTFKQLISDTKKYQNVLDSYNRETLHEIEKSIEGELNVSLGIDVSSMLSRTLGIALPASAELPLDVSAGISEGMTMNSSRGININVLGSVIDKQAAKSSNLREIEINTETNVTETTEELTELIREFENINHSRVLNFVFRQLLQEYISITYLNDVSFMYSNGYPEYTKVVKLDGLKNLIDEVIKSGDRSDVLNGILCELCSVYDYTGTIQKFIEKKSCPIEDIDGNPVRTDTYYRKDTALTQSYPSTGDPIITVNGIIMDIRQRILRTDSVIVDSLLGQGEALDCYNMKLQDAATIKAQLDNDALTQQIAIIDALTTEADKADKYKKVFGKCCETPQTQIIS